MQDCYVGDIGDFGKYGLLRALQKEGFSLGVIWYRVNWPECHPDGNRKNYPQYRSCDPELYEKLQRIIEANRRLVGSINSDGILSGAKFFDDFVPVRARGMNRNEMLASRERWMEGAIKTIFECDIVFLDPDNGFQVRSTPRHYKKGVKYVYYDELERLYRQKKSIVVYQHADRTGIESQIKTRREEIQSHLKLDVMHPLPVLVGNSRLYFFIPQDKKSAVFFQKFLKQFRSLPWSAYFSAVDSDERAEGKQR
jgi:hypothetical protein